MKHTKEQVKKYMKVLQLMHAFGELEPEKVVELEAIKGWKWETFNCTKAEAFVEAVALTNEVLGGKQYVPTSEWAKMLATD